MRQNRVARIVTATGTARKQALPRARTGAAGGNGTTLTLNRRPGSASQGVLVMGGRALPCAIGRSGIRSPKREGDGATPAGRLAPVAALWRPDRGPPPATRLPLHPIGPRDGWCDAAFDGNYNRPVGLPYARSHEVMTRADALYDMVVVLDWNFRRRLQGRGSAIFLHLARPGFRPTEGCIAVTRPTMRLLLARLGRRDTIRIAGSSPRRKAST